MRLVFFMICTREKVVEMDDWIAVAAAGLGSVADRICFVDHHHTWLFGGLGITGGLSGIGGWFFPAAAGVSNLCAGS